MDESQMLKAMCNDVLSETDIKAIGKIRGFTAKEIASRSLFENIFLSRIGVKEAIATLTIDEICMLHLLKYRNMVVDISFFYRLYGGIKTPGYMSYTESYKSTFKEVKERLVRKGLLIICEKDETYRKSSKMERWRFKFPCVFEKCITHPFTNILKFTENGKLNQKAAREKLQELAENKSVSKPDTKKNNRSNYHSDDALSIESFRVNSIHSWQRNGWLKACKLNVLSGEVNPVKTLIYALSQLNDDEWILPEEQLPLFKIFCNHIKDFDPDSFCRLGWEMGSLLQHTADGKTHYRVPLEFDPDNDLHEKYLSIKGDAVVINLNEIPYKKLEILTKSSDIKFERSEVTARPNIIKIGNLLETEREDRLFSWLRKKSLPYENAIKVVEERQGKRIIHKNLLVARIKDLSLKVKIEKRFAGTSKIVTLSKEYISFPKGALPEIEKIMKKSGHVIKRAKVN